MAHPVHGIRVRIFYFFNRGTAGHNRGGCTDWAGSPAAVQVPADSLQHVDDQQARSQARSEQALAGLRLPGPDHIFPFRIHGDVYAANKKTKKPCRIPIMIPDDLDDTTNLKFLDNWKFLVFAFPNKKEGENKDE